MYELITNTVKKHKVFQYEALATAVGQTKIVNDIKAKLLASTNKRIDVCAAEIAHQLHCAPEIKIENRVCLEVGSGWVLSYAIVHYLLGAKKVIATDIAPIAVTGRIYDAVHHSTAYVIRDILSAFGDYEAIRERLDHLLSIKQFDEKALESLGITYLAPVDFAEKKFSEEVDYIYSRAVMCVLPRTLVRMIVENLYRSLRTGGIMAHDIHLEDIKSHDQAPFAFYEVSESDYLPEYDSLRGNRIRAGEWEDIFQQVSNGNARVYYRRLRKPETLPKKIDESIKYQDLDDLRTSHLGILSGKS